MKKLIYIIIIIAFAPSLKAQFAAILTSEGFTRLENDSAILVPDENLRGTFQWQKSIDSTTWTSIEANLAGDSLAFVPELTEVYRLQIMEGTCMPLYTDTIKVFSQNTTVSEYLLSGISIPDLLAAGVSVADLLAEGVSVADLLGAGASVSDLLAAGVSVTVLFDAGVMVGTLEQNDADSADLTNAGLTGILTDTVGNNYKWVRIGEQYWMAENLKTTKYNDGTSIPFVTGYTEWMNLSTPGYCWYNNDSSTYADPYGALYNWYVVDTIINGNKNVCPTGWHVSAYEEWDTLTDYLGGVSVAGGKLKAKGTIWGEDGLWLYPNTGATNETGFTALPCGHRAEEGSFYHISKFGYWWNSPVYYIAKNMSYNSSDVGLSGSSQNVGFSVRCLRD